MKKTNRLLSIFLAALMIVLAVPTAFAANIVKGDVGNIHWELDRDSGVLTITGSGAMPDNSHPWYSYRNSIKTVEIENGITTVGTTCFGGNYNTTGTYGNIIKVSLPDSLIEIKNQAFLGCSNLEEIIIPSNVNYIAPGAFHNCTLLSSVNIPEGVTTISKQTFQYCSSLTELILPAHITSIGDEAFEGCKRLERINMPEDLITIGDEAFWGCALTSVILPDGISSIGSHAFRSNKALKNVIIPNSAETVKSAAFSGCTELTDVVFSNAVTEISSNMFYECSNLKSFIVPNRVETIEKNAFYNCEYLREVFIPKSLTTIGSSAFYGCSRLKDIYYEGTEDEWKQISGRSTIPSSATIHYNSTGPTVDNPDDPNNPEVSKNVTITGILEEYVQTTILNNEAVAAYVSEVTVDGKEYPVKQGVISDTTAESYKHQVVQLTIADKKVTKIELIGSPNEVIFKGIFESCVNSSVLNEEQQQGYVSSVIISGVNFAVRKGAIPSSDNIEQYVYSRVKAYVQNGEIIAIKELTGEEAFNIYIWLDDQEKTISTDKCIDYYVLNKDSTTYSPRLASMLMGFADGAYDPNRIKRSLESHGFVYNFVSPLYSSDADYYAACTISKKVMQNGETLVLVAIRGTQGEKEWIGNAAFTDLTNIVSTGPHPNFDQSAELIYDYLRNQLGGTIKASGVKYLITGHSKGAAVANLLSIKLREANVPKSNIYDYNFACPDVAVDAEDNWNKNGQYNNMFNICCHNDPVAYIPGKIADYMSDKVNPFNSAVWGKYGVTLWFADDWTNNDLAVSYHLMPNYLKQMKKEDPFSGYKPSADQLTESIIDKLLRIKCPVDVTLYDGNQNAMCAIIDNKIQYYKYCDRVIAFVDNGHKAFLMLDDFDFSLSLKGTDTGTMTIAAETIDIVNKTVAEKATYENIVLYNGKTFNSIVPDGGDLSELKVYCVNSNGEIIAVVQSDGSEIPLSTPDTPDEPQPENLCKWCGGEHTGFFGGIVGFFHRIFAAIFGARY